MEEVIQVAVREGRGSQAAKRLRSEGKIPAILYGHGEENVSLAVPAGPFEAALRHGNLVVELAGGVKETAFIRDVQWDTYGAEVLHVDFTRVSAGEMVTTTVPVELRGEAPGAKEGGMVEILMHEVEIELPADQMVDHLELSINDLHLNDSLTAEALELPKGGSLTDPSAVIVHCVEPMPVEEEEVEPVDASEPEIIGESEDEADEE